MSSVLHAAASSVISSWNPIASNVGLWKSSMLCNLVHHAVSVRFGLSKGLLNKKVIAIVKEKETEEADKALVLHELLTEV